MEPSGGEDEDGNDGTLISEEGREGARRANVYVCGIWTLALSRWDE